MKKKYEKPEMDVLTLISEESVTNDPSTDGIEGDLDASSNTLFQ